MERVSHYPEPLDDPGKDDRAAHGVPVVPAFDGYRAFAIMAIVLFHTLINSGVVQRLGVVTDPLHATGAGYPASASGPDELARR